LGSLETNDKKVTGCEGPRPCHRNWPNNPDAVSGLPTGFANPSARRMSRRCPQPYITAIHIIHLHRMGKSRTRREARIVSDCAIQSARENLHFI